MITTKISYQCGRSPDAIGSEPAPEDSAQDHARRKAAKALLLKAAEYIDALRLETSLIVDDVELRVLRLALFQDFVEVHNAALRGGIRLPEDRGELGRLLG
jgi:hypothetical protein